MVEVLKKIFAQYDAAKYALFVAEKRHHSSSSNGNGSMDCIRRFEVFTICQFCSCGSEISAPWFIFDFKSNRVLDIIPMFGDWLIRHARFQFM